MENNLSNFETQTDYVYGGFWERFVAKLIDGIVVGVVNGIINFGITAALGAGMTSTVAGMLVGFALQIGYNIYFLTSDKMATPGKQVMNLRIIDAETGGKLSTGKVVGRYFAEILSSIILLIGYIMAAFDSKKQALHDKLVGTYVVKG